MSTIDKPVRAAAAAAAIAVLAFAGGARADGTESLKDAPAEAARAFTYAVTLGATSDYVFRGISQNQENPAFQAALDVGYGIFYAGIWGSSIDFGADKLGQNDSQLGPDTTAEVDLYAGIKPVWGPLTFDFGAIYYWYPNAESFANFNHGCPDPVPGTAACPDKLDYVELKAGYSFASPWIKNLVTGTTLYWSPDYALETGEVVTLESTAAYTLPQIGALIPTLSGTYGKQWGDLKEGYSVGGTGLNGDDEYSYWNAGVSIAVEKITFDLRYWDSDIDVGSQFGSVCVDKGLCDERFVFSARIVLP